MGSRCKYHPGEGTGGMVPGGDLWILRPCAALCGGWGLPSRPPHSLLLPFPISEALSVKYSSESGGPQSLEALEQLWLFWSPSHPLLQKYVGDCVPRAILGTSLSLSHFYRKYCPRCPTKEGAWGPVSIGNMSVMSCLPDSESVLVQSIFWLLIVNNLF